MYQELLLHSVGLQFSTLIESGCILYFLNISEKKETLTQYYSVISKISTIQIIASVIVTQVYCLLYLKTSVLVISILVSSYAILNLSLIPRLYLLACNHGYQRVQKIKTIQAFITLTIILLLVLLKNIYFLCIAYFTSALFIFIYVSAINIEKKNLQKTTVSVYNALSYVAKILPSSFGWIFMNLLLGHHTNSSGNTVVIQNWLVFRTADNLLSGVFANKITKYLGKYSTKNFFGATQAVLSKEYKMIAFISLCTTIMSVTVFGSVPVALWMLTWIILHRINATFNIFILKRYKSKNLYNFIITLLGIIIGFIIFGDLLKFEQHIVFIWLIILITNFLYRYREI